MSGVFDSFLYVPPTPPATPSPTKKKPLFEPPTSKSPKLQDLADVKLRPPSTLSFSPPRTKRKQEELGTSNTRKSPRFVEPSPSPPSQKKESSKKKARKAARPYADPSLYAHLPQSLSDIIAPNLTLLVIGLNPGVMTATTGHHFANPTNLFWPLLYSSGIIEEPLKAAESECIIARYNVGITNIVDRPTAEGGELSRQECVEGAVKTIEKVKQWKPKAVLVTGKGIWEAMFTAIHGRTMRKADGFEFGWQEETLDETRIYVTMGTSGRVAAYSPAYKRQIFAGLGKWVKAERDRNAKLVADIDEPIQSQHVVVYSDVKQEDSQ